MQGVSRGFNHLRALEQEIGFNMSPTAFAEAAGSKITLAESRGILKAMGINIPQNVTKGTIKPTIEGLPKMSSQQINQYYNEAKKIMTQTTFTAAIPGSEAQRLLHLLR